MAVGTDNALSSRTLKSSFTTQLIPCVPFGCNSPSTLAAFPLTSNVRFIARITVVFEAAVSGCLNKGGEVKPRSASTALPTNAPTEVFKNCRRENPELIHQSPLDLRDRVTKTHFGNGGKDTTQNNIDGCSIFVSRNEEGGRRTSYVGFSTS